MTQTRMKATSGAQPQMCSGTAALSLWASPPTALHNWVQVTAQLVPLRLGWAQSCYTLHHQVPALPCASFPFGHSHCYWNKRDVWIRTGCFWGCWVAACRGHCAAGWPCWDPGTSLASGPAYTEALQGEFGPGTSTGLGCAPQS